MSANLTVVAYFDILLNNRVSSNAYRFAYFGGVTDYGGRVDWHVAEAVRLSRMAVDGRR